MRASRSSAPAFALALSVLALGCSSSDASSTSGGAQGESDADLAAEAVVWGYPLVVSERTMQGLGHLVGENKLFNQAALSNAQTRVIVAPNHDTLYSIAVLDLRSEPMVLKVPSVSDRYWVYQFLDAWTDSFAYLGTRASQGEGGTFVIAWPGAPPAKVPPGAMLVPTPTAQVFLLGRYLVKDDADVANVTALARTIVPLHTLIGGGTPPAPPPLGTAPGKPIDVGMEGIGFFDELGDVLAIDGPITDADVAALGRFSKLGIGIGMHPAASASGAAKDALEQGLAKGIAQISAAIATHEHLENGWDVHLDIPERWSDPLLRAATAMSVWGANVSAEAVYPLALADASGAAFDGKKRYVLHFDANGYPPVDAKHGFWSVTLYGPDRFFADNPLHRFALGDRSQGLVKNADGSLDIYVQADSPAGHEGNWLPSPASGAFELMLRFYLPGTAITNGAYVYPKVTAR